MEEIIHGKVVFGCEVLLRVASRLRVVKRQYCECVQEAQRAPFGNRCGLAICAGLGKNKIGAYGNVLAVQADLSVRINHPEGDQGPCFQKVAPGGLRGVIHGRQCPLSCCIATVYYWRSRLSSSHSQLKS